MKLAIRTALLTILVLASAASRVGAGGSPATPPKPPAPAAPPEAPAPPAPPRSREIVVDGDRVSVWDDDGDGDFDVEAPDAPEGPAMIRIRRHEGDGYLGFLPIWMTPELRQHFGAPKDAGVLVGKVEADSPAARAGLEVGDIVTAIGGERVKSTSTLVREVRRSKEGETLQLEIVRSRATKTLPITVGKRPAEELRIGDLSPMYRMHGMERGHPRSFVAPLPPDFAGLDERMEELEKRLKELEKRLPSK